MSKCQTVQDELKINELVVKKKSDKLIEQKVLRPSSERSSSK